MDAVADHLLHRNVQRGGRYRQSQEVDADIAQARASVALLVNARHPDENFVWHECYVFMRLVSLAIGQSFKDRREIIVTDLDHESNIAVWLALEREGAKIVWWSLSCCFAKHHRSQDSPGATLWKLAVRHFL